MPRMARTVAIGFPHHVAHRGNNRRKIFIDSLDYERYLFLLRKYSSKFKVLISTYCLMPNHVHLILKPLAEKALSKMMQGVALSYALYVNRKYRKTGRLWESRHHSSIIDTDEYFWTAARYVEQNPRRARLVKREEDYPYSSARAHILGETDKTLSEALFDEKQRRNYAKFVHDSLSEEQIKRITSAVKAGVPLGSQKFIREMEQKFKRSFRVRAPGRPKQGGAQMS